MGTSIMGYSVLDVYFGRFWSFVIKNSFVVVVSTLMILWRAIHLFRRNTLRARAVHGGSSRWIRWRLTESLGCNNKMILGVQRSDLLPHDCSVIFLVRWFEVPVWQNLDWGTWSAYEARGPRGGEHGPPRFRSTDGMIVGWENNNLPGDVIWIQLLNKSEYHRCDLINLFKLIRNPNQFIQID